MQAKTVPRLFEHPPPQAPAGAGPSTMTVTRPKERQVCPLLRTLLKRDRGSN
jgi:sucrose synthase